MAMGAGIVYLWGLESNRATATFLQQQGWALCGWDEDANARTQAAQATSGLHGVTITPPEEAPWEQISGVMLGTGQLPTFLLRQKMAQYNVSIWSELDVLQKAAPEATYIAITGTSGKSTAVALVAHLLREAGHQVAVGGHMGCPALAMPLLPAGGFYVLEVSSFQLLEMRTFRANIAVLLNISPEHLDVHRTMEAYLAVKRKIFQNQTPQDVRVLSVDNYELEEMGISLGLNVPLRRLSVTGVGADISVTTDGRLLDYDTTPSRFILNLNGVTQLKGLHHWQNITCAWAATKGLITQKQFMAGVDSFKGVKHRYQRVVEKEGVSFINDSKATTGVAAARALENTQNPFWIVGGESREEGITPCTEQFKNVKGVYLIGAATEEFAQTLAAAAYSGPVNRCENLHRAMAEAYSAAQSFVKQTGENATVLLSPACNSFDQFYSFEHRGQVFIDQAHALTNTSAEGDD